MIKVQFDISDFDSKEEMKHLLKNGEYISNLDEIYQLVRGWLKHGDTEHLKEDDIQRLEQIKSLASISIE